MVNSIFYRLGIILFIAASAAAILQNTGAIDLTTFLYPCLFHQLSGLYCPGCGGTRAVKALLEGHFISCFLYHPFIFYCFILYLLFMGSHTLERIQKKVRLKTAHLSSLPIGKLASHMKNFPNKPQKSPHKKPLVRGMDFKVTYVYIGILVILIQWMIKNITLLL